MSSITITNPTAPTFVVMQGAGIDPTGVADSTSAIQAIIDANATAGAVYFFPAGLFKLTSALVLPAQDSIFMGVPGLSGGASRGSRLQNIVTDMFVPHASNTMYGVSFQDLSFKCGGGSGGHIFNFGTAGVSSCVWERCVFTQQNTGKSIHYSVNGTYIDNLVIGGQCGSAAAATVPAWYYSSNGGAVNSNTWTRMRWTYSGTYQIHIESTSAGSYCYDNVIRDITSEIPTGGIGRFWGCRNTLIEQVNTYDLGVVNATTAHLFEFGRQGGGTLYSTANTVRNCELHNPQLMGSGMAHIHSQGGRIMVESCNGIQDLGSGGNNLVINPHNASPAASIINVLDTDLIFSPDNTPPWAPIDRYDAIASGVATFDRRDGLVDTALGFASTNMQLVYFTATKSITSTAVQAWTGTTVAAATPTLCQYVLFSEDGSRNLTQIAITANDTSMFATGNTKYTKSWGSSVGIVRGQRYAVGILIVSAAAMPSFLGRCSPGSGAIDTIWGATPRFTGIVNAQASVPSTVTAAGVANTRRHFYAEIV